MGITSKRLVATLLRKYNLTQRLTFNVVGMRSVELSHAIKITSNSQKSNRPQACSKLFPQVCVRDRGDHVNFCNIGDKRATLLHSETI